MPNQMYEKFRTAPPNIKPVAVRNQPASGSGKGAVDK